MNDDERERRSNETELYTALASAITRVEIARQKAGVALQALYQHINTDQFDADEMLGLAGIQTQVRSDLRHALGMLNNVLDGMEHAYESGPSRSAAGTSGNTVDRVGFARCTTAYVQDPEWHELILKAAKGRKYLTFGQMRRAAHEILYLTPGLELDLEEATSYRLANDLVEAWEHT